MTNLTEEEANAMVKDISDQVDSLKQWFDKLVPIAVGLFLIMLGVGLCVLLLFI